jgi:hypothetical protein
VTWPHQRRHRGWRRGVRAVASFVGKVSNDFAAEVAAKVITRYAGVG